jgi:hypothetical protein
VDFDLWILACRPQYLLLISLMNKVIVQSVIAATAFSRKFFDDKPKKLA